MHSVTKITLWSDSGEKFFGEGPCQLLKAVEDTGSLRAAAASMGMAYTKALKILKQAEAALGFSLTERTVGGRAGGGSRLTPEGHRFLARYEGYRNACQSAGKSLFRQFFPQVGCVIMASGQGKRFGGNKLMASFRGMPMLCRVLDATDGVFARRVAVTRHADGAQVCRERNVETILHSLPSRSDTVRLGLETIGDMDACLFCPADQPLLTNKTLAALLDAWEQDRDKIWRVGFQGEAGAPVLFPAWAFGELRSLPEGAGGSHLLKKYPDRVRVLEAGFREELLDADTPEQLKFLEGVEAP